MLEDEGNQHPARLGIDLLPCLQSHDQPRVDARLSVFEEQLSSDKVVHVVSLCSALGGACGVGPLDETGELRLTPATLCLYLDIECNLHVDRLAQPIFGVIQQAAVYITSCLRQPVLIFRMARYYKGTFRVSSKSLQADIQ